MSAPLTRQRMPAAQTSGQRATLGAKSEESRRVRQSSAPSVRPRCLNCAGQHEYDVAKHSNERQVTTDRPTAVRREWQPPNVANPLNKADARWDPPLVFGDTGSVVCTTSMAG